MRYLLFLMALFIGAAHAAVTVETSESAQVPTVAELDAVIEDIVDLEQRVSDLESSGGGSGQKISIEVTPRGSERHATIPVGNGVRLWRNIMELQVDHVVAGEKWLVFSTYHGTNTDLRSRGYGIAAVTELRWGGVCGNDDRDGNMLNEDTGGQNVSVKAHHDYRVQVGTVTFTQDYSSVCVKNLMHAKSSQSESGDEYEITHQRGYIYVIRIKP